LTLSYAATLRTERLLPRPIVYYGSTYESVEGVAQKWLQANGEHGDSFVIIENVPVERAVIECQKPKRERVYKGHAFVSGPNLNRCDVCGRKEEEHK
jgi:hypothetical protein